MIKHELQAFTDNLEELRQLISSHESAPSPDKLDKIDAKVALIADRQVGLVEAIFTWRQEQ